MKILLLGATGMIGSRILTEALARGHTITAMARNPDNAEKVAGAKYVAADVNDVQAVTTLASEADIVISALSPRNAEDPHEAAVQFSENLIEVARATGKRLLTVGGGSTLQTPEGVNRMEQTPDFILSEAGGMRQAYGMMVLADIDFVTLAPGGMIEPGERTGKFRLSGRTIVVAPDGGVGRISAEDFAIGMVDEAETPMHFRTIFNIGY